MKMLDPLTPPAPVGAGDAFQRLAAMLQAPPAPRFVCPPAATVASLERLGNGAYGIAFGLTDSLVLKITTGTREFQTSEKLVKVTSEGYRFQRVWNVWASGWVKDEQDLGQALWGRKRACSLFWIIGERLQPLSQAAKRRITWGNPEHRRLCRETNEELFNFGLSHGDMHTGNLLQTKTHRLKFVDVQ